MLRVRTPLVAVVLVLGWPISTAAQSVTEILNKHYEASGGLAKLKAVTSMRITGRMMMGQGMEAPFTRLTKRPSMMRMDFTVQGVTGIQAYDGETAWMLMPFMGQTAAEKMPPDLAKTIQEDADFDGVLVDYQAKGHQVELLGKESVEGTDAYQLKVTLKNGEVTTYFLDAEYFLVVKTESKRTIQGREFAIATTYGDYKSVGGRMMPHSIRVAGQGPGMQTILVEKVELNAALDDAQFKMPTKP